MAELHDFYSRWFQSLFYWKGGAKLDVSGEHIEAAMSFNPCFTGRGGLNNTAYLHDALEMLFQSLFYWKGGAKPLANPNTLWSHRNGIRDQVKIFPNFFSHTHPKDAFISSRECFQTLYRQYKRANLISIN